MTHPAATAPREAGEASPSPIDVSVVVPTRHRAQHAAACVDSILRNDGLLELLLVDQSDDHATEQALAGVQDRRLRYVRTQTRGVTLARNVGFELSRGAVVACTDDDCRVAPDWIPRLAAIFADPEVAVVCGRVHVPDELRHLGYAAEFEPEVRVWQRRFPPLGHDWGITANLAVRRDVLPRVGDFDPMLGSGAPLHSGGEPDFLYRVLKAGLKVVNAAEVSVDHLGIRAPGPETKELWRRYARGTAAALFKHVRLGDPTAAALYARWLGSCFALLAANLARGKRPLGAGYISEFLRGSVESLKFRVDRPRRQYLPR